MGADPRRAGVQVVGGHASLTYVRSGGKVLATIHRPDYSQAPSYARTHPVAAMNKDYEKEIAKGRIPLWLDPDDLRFLACEYSRLPEDSPEDLTRLWMRIAARAHAALQKSGHELPPFKPTAGGGPVE